MTDVGHDDDGADGPLAGLRVADFTWMGAGTMATRPLANLGAEVIKIESSARVDGFRMGGPRPDRGGAPNLAPPDPDASGIFNDCNTSKLSLTLNLNHAAGIDLAKRLIAISDVVTNNFTGTRMDRWGLGYDDLRAIKPDIIMLQMPVMGSTGPLRDYRGLGPHMTAMIGMNEATGLEGRPPTGSDVAWADFSGNPNHAAFAVLSALHYRRRTGTGQLIDLSQYESTANLMGPYVLDYTVNGRVPSRAGNRQAGSAPHGAYRCSGDDRWVAVAVSTDTEWEGLVRAIGFPGWTRDARFQTLAARIEHHDELDEQLEGWTSQRSPHEAMQQLQAEGVPAGAVQDIEDLIERDPHWRTRQLRYVEHPVGGVFATHGETIRVDGREAPAKRAPLLGEHSDQILREQIGLTIEQINQLYMDGVVA